MREQLGFETVVTGYGLTESHRHRHHVPPRRRPRDDRQHRRPAPSPTSRCASSTTTARPLAPASPARSSCAGYNVMQRLLRRPGGDRRGDRRRRLAAHRRHRGHGRARQPEHHRPQEGHVHRRRFNAYPAEIENMHACDHPGVGQVAVVGVPDERLGEVGMAFVVPTHRAPTSTPTSSSRGAASTWPTTRCRATSRSSTRCRSTRRQGAQVRAGGAGEGAAGTLTRRRYRPERVDTATKYAS